MNYTAIDWLIDRYHVGTPFAEIEKDVRRKANKSKLTPAQVQGYVDRAKVRHEQNRALYIRVTGGRI